jgi:hypothetical protein
LRQHTAKEAFYSLPIGPEPGRKAGVYFAGENTIVVSVDESGVGWKVGRYLDGEWFRESVDRRAVFEALSP